MSNWENYKESVQSLRDKIAALQKEYYTTLEKCTCEERVSKANYTHGTASMRPTKTTFDECVVCMRIFNVKTLINGEFRERRSK